MNVLDASALLAFSQGEEGADGVEAALLEHSCCSSANWSEVSQQVLARGGDWSLCGTYEYIQSITLNCAHSTGRFSTTRPRRLKGSS